MISSVGHITSPSSCLDVGTSVQPYCMERIPCGVSMEGWEAGRLECGRKGLGSSRCSLHSAHLQFGLFSQVLIFSLEAECFLTHGELCQCLAPSSALDRSSTACNLGGMCTLSSIAEAPPNCDVSSSSPRDPFFPQKSWKLPHAGLQVCVNYSLGPG